MIQRKQSLFLLVVFVLSIVGAMLQVGNIEPSGMGVGDNVYSLCILHADGSRGDWLCFFTFVGHLYLEWHPFVGNNLLV